MGDTQDADAQIAEMHEEVTHLRRVIAWLLTSHRSQDGSVPKVGIPYRCLDELGETSVLVRRHYSNNDVVEFSLMERAEVLPL